MLYYIKHVKIADAGWVKLVVKFQILKKKCLCLLTYLTGNLKQWEEIDDVRNYSQSDISD